MYGMKAEICVLGESHAVDKCKGILPQLCYELCCLKDLTISQSSSRIGTLIFLSSSASKMNKRFRFLKENPPGSCASFLFLMFMCICFAPESQMDL